ncbi:MAG: replication-associated recombination protein A [Corynebacterium sp.]|nr:replication-associated recombination protein A [Corynebacterium sp.]
MSALASLFAHQSPLAVRMRPRNLDEVVGQEHLLGPDSPLRKLINGQGVSSVILYGPPGTGKTTLANLLAQDNRFIALSALNSGVKEVRDVIQKAEVSNEHTVLFIDEVHRFSKTQQDALLAAVENRTILLVAATTENPSFSVVAPLLSRSLVLQTRPLTAANIESLIDRALTDERGLNNEFTLDEDAKQQLIRLADGDARRCLTYLEAVANTVESTRHITSAAIEKAIDKALVRYDKDGDQHYDVTSAFIKSIRGSDVDAALHYLARMIEAGEDPRFIARRLVIHASEDIGMADPQALQVAVAAAQAVQMIGMPEARINLAQATIHLATAPKSNAVITAIDSALADVRKGQSGSVPPHLRDGHYAGAKKLGNAQGYIYPHNDPMGVVAQQYMPDNLQGRQYYKPTNRGYEGTVRELLKRIRNIIAGRN